MKFIYSISIFFYYLAIIIASPFNKKANKWLKGRKNIFVNLKNACLNKNNIVCFHCASLGEFEQGKPFIQKYKKSYPDTTIMVSFFSPSGYDIQKNTDIADIVCYIPVDLKRPMKKFVDIVNPKMFFFIKYEYWFNLIDILLYNKTPMYVISAAFRQSQYYFKCYGKWFAQELNKIDCFFLQNKKSQELLYSINIKQSIVTGDTRFDRVNAIATQFESDILILKFINGQKTIVAGSTWTEDEIIIKQFFDRYHNKYKLIIAPHQIDKKHINNILSLFKCYKILIYSQINDSNNIRDYDILLVDTIGLLSKLYKYGYFAYVGGAFRTGLHNILEAAVFGKPILFGNNFDRFNEAIELIERKGAFSISNVESFFSIVYQFDSNKLLYEQCCSSCMEYVKMNLGASDKILNYLKYIK